MKKFFSGLLAIALTSLVQAASAASLAAGDTIKLTDSYGSTGGGEFIGTILSGAAAPGSFITFCVEKNEFFTPGQTLQVQAVSTAAVNGGAGGGNPDPLDARTAYLFTQFSLGTLSNYSYDNATARVSSANSLQKAIWYLEQEISLPSSDTQAQSWINEATNKVSSGEWSGIGDVRVLNLYRWDSATHSYSLPAQDQLYVIPIPEPETYAMLLAGLGLLGFAMRRRFLRGTPSSTGLTAA